LGFSLIEVVIAVAILVVVMSSTLVVLTGATRAWRKGQGQAERYQQARLLMDLFGRELRSSLAGSQHPFLGLSAADATALKPASMQQAVFFVGALPGRAGLVERGYWMAADQTLMCHDEEPADGDYATVGADEICAQRVSGFSVSYFDGVEWLAAWDGRPDGAQAGRLPTAVRLTLTLDGPHEESFETVVHVATS